MCLRGTEKILLSRRFSIRRTMLSIFDHARLDVDDGGMIPLSDALRGPADPRSPWALWGQVGPKGIS